MNQHRLSWAVATAAAVVVAAWFTGAFVAARYEARLGHMARETAALRGLGPSPEATGRVLWHPAIGGHLFVAGLPPAAPGKAYAVWSIADAAPRPAGVLRVDAEGRGSLRLAPAEGGKPVKVFAITLEPEVGVAAPSGPMVLRSK